MKCSKCGSEDVSIQMKGSENDGVYCYDCSYNSAGDDASMTKITEGGIVVHDYSTKYTTYYVTSMAGTVIHSTARCAYISGTGKVQKYTTEDPLLEEWIDNGILRRCKKCYGYKENKR